VTPSKCNPIRKFIASARKVSAVIFTTAGSENVSRDGEWLFHLGHGTAAAGRDVRGSFGAAERFGSSVLMKLTG
jgi:hypothetical protein